MLRLNRRAFVMAMLVQMLVLAAAGNAANAQNPTVLETVHNFRDIGGYKTQDGHTVRRGILYRSASLSDMSAMDREKLLKMGIRNEIDLRGPVERAQSPSRWGRETPTILAPFPDLPKMPVNTGRLYAALARDRAADIGSALKGLERTDGATILHCAAGADRTGITVAVLMTIVGVPRQQVLQEYLRSNEYWTSEAGRNQRFNGHFSKEEANTWPALAAEYKAWPGLSSTTLNNMFSLIDLHYGSFGGYVRDGLKMTQQDVAHLRARFLRSEITDVVHRKRSLRRLPPRGINPVS